MSSPGGRCRFGGGINDARSALAERRGKRGEQRGKADGQRRSSWARHHPDLEKHAFQYVDWQFDGADLVAASRTAFDDGLGGAHNQHDANYMTFHRVRAFRAQKSR